MTRDQRFAFFHRRDADTDEPPSWLRSTLMLLWDNLATLALLNLVASLVAAPFLLLAMAMGVLPMLVAAVIAFPLILGGLTAAVSGEWRGLPGSMRERFVQTIRSRWLALLPLGVIAAVCATSSIITTSLVLAGADRWLLFLWLAQCGFLVLAVMLLLYAVPLVAAHELSPRLALRNALVLTIAAPLPTLGIFALLVLLAVLQAWIGLGLWLIVPVIGAVFVATNCEYQIERLQQVTNQ
jgi:uncharacterized membrane protein YesL